MPSPKPPRPCPLPRYDSILLAVDSSDHSDRAVNEALALAGIWESRLSAAHVYAARLHDRRFRQMEGGLPEPYREERELERQRDVHDDLITKGLSIITDSYLDQVARQSEKMGIEIARRSLEGKNYREMVNEGNSGSYDLLVLGALGLGAVERSRIGTVCLRTVRRSRIDTLVIKEPGRSIAEGPIVAAVDGSPKSYGGLLTALALGREWGSPVKVISAFDPYYHYVAFNRISRVLSEEAGKVFRFQEQEQLHEDIIDSGLAKIYQGHLTLSQQIAADHGMEVETELLDGKPHDVIRKYLERVRPSLLVLGKTGIHADDELDIGGNTEALLYDADCALLLSQREHQLQVDRQAEITTSWTREAEARMERVPSFVRNMARTAILRHAQEQGHTVITESLVAEAAAKLMPGNPERAMAEIAAAFENDELKSGPTADIAMHWSEQASQRLLTVKDLALRGNLGMRAEKRARADNSQTVEEHHILPFITGADTPSPLSTVNCQPSKLHWHSAALARLMRVPAGFMRDGAKARIETLARTEGIDEITLAVAERGLAEARSAMEEQVDTGNSPEETPTIAFDNQMDWSDEAKTLLQNIPVGFCLDMTVKAAETLARQNGLSQVDAPFVEQILQTFQAGSEAVGKTLTWEEPARQRIQKIPETVRGMLVKEIEGWVRRQGGELVTEEALDAVKRKWEERGVFHLDPDDPRSR